MTAAELAKRDILLQQCLSFGKLGAPARVKATTTASQKMSNRTSVKPEANLDLLSKNLIVVSAEFLTKSSRLISKIPHRKLKILQRKS